MKSIQNEPSSERISVQELSAQWHISESRIRRWARSGILPCHRDGHRVFFFTDEVEAMRIYVWRKIGRPLKLMTRLEASLDQRTVSEILKETGETEG